MHLVLLPGMDGTGDLFAPLIGSLPADVTTTVVRYPRGEELSFAQLEELVRAAAPLGEDYCLLAESFSGPIALGFTASRPRGLRALLLCASFAKNPAPWYLRPARPMVRPALFRRVLPTWIARRFLLGTDCPQALVQSVREAIASVEPAVLAQRLRLIFDLDVCAALREVRVPLFYLVGAQDRLVGRRGARQITRTMPQAQVKTLSGPHLLLQRRPSESAEAIMAFLHDTQEVRSQEARS